MILLSILIYISLKSVVSDFIFNHSVCVIFCVKNKGILLLNN